MSRRRQTTRTPGVYMRDTPLGKRYDFVVRDEKGSQVWTSGLTSQRAAERGRVVALHDRDSGGIVRGRKTTFADFAEVWKASIERRVADGKLKASTQRFYFADLENHVLPEFGKLAVASLDNAVQIEEWYERLQDEKGLSGDTLNRLINVVGMVMGEARRQRLVNYNPVEDVRRPARNVRRPVLPTLEQVYRIAECAGIAGNLVLAAAFTGARQSELFGLPWHNVTLDDGRETALIDRQYYRGDWNTPKTAAGNRLIVLCAEAADDFRSEWLSQEVGGRPNPMSLCFPSPEGHPWHSSNFTRRFWMPAREAAGLPDLMFHDLRRFFVSHVREQSLALSVTEQIVGHADDRTHRAYTRPTEGTETLIRSSLEGVFTRREASGS